MYRYDGEGLPEYPPDHDKSKAAKGIRDAYALKSFAEEALESGTLPMHYGKLHKKALASMVGFGRSAYEQNQYIENVTNWIEKMLGQAPRQTGARTCTTQTERDLQAENERLMKRNTLLKTNLDDVNAILKKYQYEDETIDGGQARLPW